MRLIKDLRVTAQWIACSQRDCFFWIVVACNYSSGGCAAVRLRCWQRMPFSFEILHLASGKRVHNLAKRKTFCLVPSLRQAFNEVGPLWSWNITHYKFRIVHQERKDGETESSLLISWKCSQTTLLREHAAHFPQPFEIANQNPVKACLCALLMPLELRRQPRVCFASRSSPGSMGNKNTCILVIITCLNTFGLFTWF